MLWNCRRCGATWNWIEADNPPVFCPFCAASLRQVDFEAETGAGADPDLETDAPVPPVPALLASLPATIHPAPAPAPAPSAADPALERTLTVAAANPNANGAGAGPGPGPAVAEAPRARRAPTGAVLGGYELIRVLGRGGMGIVYEAREVRSGRRVALKLILADSREGDPALARFRREGRLASMVVHPRCVFVISAERHAGYPFIVMELMPGRTLKDLVERQGPLPVESAVEKILDVIDGLRAAHRLGILHRDVKPSNCFLEDNGRVKIGDFGISTSLRKDDAITRAGAYVGTPLYSSPEQIRKEELDVRADVYSVAATLFHLLTGRAPFQQEDPAAAMARALSEGPPSLRAHRRDVPRRLDRILRKGLERQRERRWATLDDFGAALVPFVPGRHGVVGLGTRLVACLVDAALLASVLVGLDVGLEILVVMHPELLEFLGPWAPRRDEIRLAVALLGSVAYFAVAETLSGATLGKWLLGVRVKGRWAGCPPEAWRALVRALLFHAILVGPAIVVALSTEGPWTNRALPMFAAVTLPFVVLFSTSWSVNGYRALHEWLSGTRTIRPHRPAPLRRSWFRPWTSRWRARVAESSRASRGPSDSSPAPDRESRAPGEWPTEIAGFTVREPRVWNDRRRLLLADDPNLGREVWIVLEPIPPGSPAIDPDRSNRHDLGRPARQRWLTSGVRDGWRWEALLAPSGVPLTRLSRRRNGLVWADTRHILETLVKELRLAREDGTLPPELTPEQVWINDAGAVQLADYALSPSNSAPPVSPEWVDSTPRAGAGPGSDSGTEPESRTGSDPKSAPNPASTPAAPGRGESLSLENVRQRLMVEFLGRVAQVALDGEPAGADAYLHPVEAAVPRHAAGFLARLLGRDGGFPDLEAVHRALRETAAMPAELDRPRKMVAIAGFLLLTLGVVSALVFGWETLGRSGRDALVVAAFAWTVLARGGLAARLSGARLVRSRNRPVGFGGALLRALIVWVPLLFLMGVHRAVVVVRPDAEWLDVGLLCAMFAWPVLCVLPILFDPRPRFLPDRMLGFEYVPE